jgi:hypothetical protein
LKCVKEHGDAPATPFLQAQKHKSMYKRVAYSLIALLVNFLLAFIMFRIRQGALPVDSNTLGYIAGHALVYWLRPFLFVALAWLFYLLTKRSFTENVALGVYAIAWAVMLVGMIYI